MFGVGSSPLTPLVVVDHLNTQNDGKVTVSNLDGTVMSVQLDGSIQTRPAGTNGPYEVAILADHMLVFHPGKDAQGHERAYVFAFVEIP